MCNRSFDNVIKIHKIDTDLRRTIFQSIEVFEISLRRNLGLFFSNKYGSFSYGNKDFFKNDEKHKKWFNGLQKKLVDKGLMSDVLIPFPVAIEALTFTGLKVFFENLSEEDQIEFSRKYNVSANKFLTWLAMLREVRNSCAHHDVIWNSKYSSKSERNQSEKDFRWLPPLVIDGEEKEKSIFYVVLVLVFLLRGMDVDSYYLKAFRSLFERITELRLISKKINIPPEWKRHPLLMIEI